VVTQLDPRYGQTAYEAYCVQSGGVSLVTGVELPPWHELCEEIQQAWIAAASAVPSGEIQ